MSTFLALQYRTFTRSPHPDDRTRRWPESITVELAAQINADADGSGEEAAGEPFLSAFALLEATDWRTAAHLVSSSNDGWARIDLYRLKGDPQGHTTPSSMASGHAAMPDTVSSSGPVEENFEPVWPDPADPASLAPRSRLKF